MIFFIDQLKRAWKPLLISAAILLLYASVLLGLVRQWWVDDNYSHGLVIPFIIAFIVWTGFDDLRDRVGKPDFAIGSLTVISALFMLVFGTLGAELLTQRLSLILLLAGVVIYFFGHKLLFSLVVPFLLVLLAIPIPQIIFNKIAFPLQLLATRAANFGLTMFGVVTQRKGNVIELMTQGAGKAALEVVEACSGIRSLMTLATLALVLAYFTTEHRPARNGRLRDFYKNPNFWRAFILMLAAVPVALITNAGRLLMTGFATYFYGQQIIETRWHDAFGWISYGIALVLLILTNVVLSRIGSRRMDGGISASGRSSASFPYVRTDNKDIVLLLMIILLTSGALNWFQQRALTHVERLSFSEFPLRIENAVRIGPDTKFNAPTERILAADDYLMRNYVEPSRKFNLYIGYYASQRTGATYHSPQNCLPGSGWEMSDGGIVTVNGSDGSSFVANRYIVQNGDNRQIMIYWYQGRGRTNSSEYRDKIDTVIDSIVSGRTDVSMVRVLTPVYLGETDDHALEAAKRFAADVYDVLPKYLPN